MRGGGSRQLRSKRRRGRDAGGSPPGVDAVMAAELNGAPTGQQQQSRGDTAYVEEQQHFARLDLDGDESDDDGWLVNASEEERGGTALASSVNVHAGGAADAGGVAAATSEPRWSAVQADPTLA